MRGMTNQTQYLSPALPMLLPHLDGSVEQVDVDEMRPCGDRWVVAQDECLGVRIFTRSPQCATTRRMPRRRVEALHV